MAEMRRRHVPQTIAVYAVAAWAAIQFADVVVPNLGWPQWVVTATIIAAGIGFPVTLALAWFLEWGPDGVHRTADEPTGEKPEARSTGSPGEAGASPTPGAAGASGASRAPGSSAARSYAPWGVAVGVLSVGIAGALIVAALQRDPPDAEGGGGPGDPAGRMAPAPDAPGEPPSIVSPAFRDSLLRTIGDSVGRGLGSLGDLGSVIDMATRWGEAGARLAAGAEATGPVRILQPDAWRVGAPAHAFAGDTVSIRGIARALGSEPGDASGEASDGASEPAGPGAGWVTAVEVDDRVVARAEGRGSPALAFSAEWVAPGPGTHEVTIRVRFRDAEPVERRSSIIVTPRGPED